MLFLQRRWVSLEHLGRRIHLESLRRHLNRRFPRDGPAVHATLTLSRYPRRFPPWEV
jgi:hypothetical protein